MVRKGFISDVRLNEKKDVIDTAGKEGSLSLEQETSVLKYSPWEIAGGQDLD